MRVFKSSGEIPKEFYHSVVCIGNFDGLHLGHQKLLIDAKAIAEDLPAQLILYSFEPHPMKVLRPEVKFQCLFPRLDLEHQAEECGVSAIVLESFDLQFASLSAQEFIETVLLEKLRAKAVVVGSNFRFGSQREGNIQLLQKILEPRGIHLLAVEPVSMGNELVSSSRIRKLINDGEVKESSKLLGRYFRLYGQVKHGDGRGSKIGSPTANIDISNDVTPAKGVYATKLVVDGEFYHSVTNVGVRPTFKNNDELVVESHVIDNQLDIYGKEVCLDFVERIRSEIRFDHVEELKTQILKDIATAKGILSNAKVD